MALKIIFERSSQKGGRQGVRKEGQQGTHLIFLETPGFSFSQFKG